MRKLTTLLGSRAIAFLLVGLAAVAALAALTITSAEAAITVVNDDFFTDGVINASAGTKTQALDAGATADMLIVGVSTEFGGGGTFTATYDGNSMVYATGNINNSNLFYIDLTGTTYTGGSADLVLTWSPTAGGDVGVGWVSVDGNLLAPLLLILAGTHLAVMVTRPKQDRTRTDRS